MKTLKFTPKSYIRHVGKEALVLDGNLTLDIIEDYTDLPMELENLYHFLSDYGTWEEAQNG